ncbi:hypothetical protein E6C60_3978 [Paenibacillus algicola]|uniref:Uncharacterized protein n=1 Tax=Paenibacillus algicola TaxID=2565926 RepID=A0A4P8XQ81_9BACL|nr:hypothetical protein E6C60_3978 [Paenibacillus algicola]
MRPLAAPAPNEHEKPNTFSLTLPKLGTNVSRRIHLTSHFPQVYI